MSEFRCYCGAEVPTWFPNEGDRQYWQEKHAKCKQAPAPTGERELDPMEYSHPTELEAQLAEQWLRAYAKRTRIHHWTLDQLLSQKYQVAAFAHWYTGHLKSSVLQEVRKQVEALERHAATWHEDDEGANVGSTYPEPSGDLLKRTDVLALLDKMEGK